MAVAEMKSDTITGLSTPRKPVRPASFQQTDWNEYRSWRSSVSSSELNAGRVWRIRNGNDSFCRLHVSELKLIPRSGLDWPIERLAHWVTEKNRSRVPLGAW